MRAIKTREDGTFSLHIGNEEEPVVSNHEVKIAVKAAGVNRADLMQRVGKYPPPPGVSQIMGLEVSGEIVEVGNAVKKFKTGDRVMALLAGGGYAEYAVADSGSVMPIPAKIDYINAAGIPEVFLTAYQALFLLGNLQKSETILIHAGASGVGTAAIQLARESGAKIIVTAGSDEKISFCKHLGAHLGINYRKEPNFDELARKYSSNGVDLIIDFIGADYMSKNINSVGIDGRIVMLAFMSGAIAENVNLAQILTKRITFKGSTLRSRSNEYKTDLVNDFQKSFFSLFEQQKLEPIIDSVVSWSKVEDAHLRIEQNLNIGKIILQLD